MPVSALESQRIAQRRRVRAHAARTHGVFRRCDLTALGIDIIALRTFVRRGWWTRLHHGVYIDSDVLASAADPLSRARVYATAAIRALPGDAYAFGPTAARLHGLAFDRAVDTGTSVVRPLAADQRALHRRVTTPSLLTEVSVHRHALCPEHLTVIDGIPCVDRKTAAITTACLSTPMWALVTLDALSWQDPGALSQLPIWTQEWAGSRGIGTVRAVLPLVRSGAQSPLESISRYQLVTLGLPEPQLQRAFSDADGVIGYADMAWPDLRVIGEADGFGKYDTRDDLIAEKVREDRLRALGWIVVRWTWNEILGQPRMVAARIRKAADVALTRSA